MTTNLSSKICLSILNKYLSDNCYIISSAQGTKEKEVGDTALHSVAQEPAQKRSVPVLRRPERTKCSEKEMSTEKDDTKPGIFRVHGH